MKKYIQLLCCMFTLSHISMLQSSWFITSFDNKTDLRLVKATRNHDVEIPSISALLAQSDHLHPVFLSADGTFGSRAGCKIIGYDTKGLERSFVFFGDPAYRVANGRAAYTDLESRNAAATLLSSMMARVFVIQPDGTTQLIGYTGYEDNNQPIALTLQGTDGTYAVAFTLIK